MEAFKREITQEQLRKWWIFYLVEPWGSPWRMAGRQTAILSAVQTGKWDRYAEERFGITYLPGDEYRPKVPVDESELAEKLRKVMRVD